MPPELEDDELFRFGEIAYDVAHIFGVTTEQGLKRARRSLNRAMIDLVGHDRKWSWRKTKDSFFTLANVREYSMQRDVRADIQHFFMEGANRGIITRIPTTKFVKIEPDANTTTGTPTMFDYEGVDSSGCIVVSFYPIPASAIEVFFRYTKLIKPLSDPDKDVRTYWGLPDNMLNALTQKAAAFCVQGTNQEKYMELNAGAEAEIALAYAADQARSNTRYIAKTLGNHDRVDGDPLLPPQFEREW